ncbi:MAG TPA: FkbM family methyltransferase [Steroidobacteraceae bacterium]|nr:FkbM family methyltransferase [Steroidobacteraceae bacterium]
MPEAYQCKALARNLLAHLGLRAHRRADTLRRLLQRFEVDLVLDVGANAGQFARQLRAMGYRHRIVSFEPLAQPFRKLRFNTATIKSWQAVQLALGDTDETRSIHVAGNSQSSSFLEMLPQHLAAAPKSAYVGTESVTVRRLDSVIDQYCGPRDRMFLKIDTQGFEAAVLRGAPLTLPRCIGVQLEMSIAPLYQGELLLPELIDKMAAHGFALMHLKPGFFDPRTGELLQLDGLFFRRTVLSPP